MPIGTSLPYASNTPPAEQKMINLSRPATQARSPPHPHSPHDLSDFIGAPRQTPLACDGPAEHGVLDLVQRATPPHRRPRSGCEPLPGLHVGPVAALWGVHRVDPNRPAGRRRITVLTPREWANSISGSVTTTENGGRNMEPQSESRSPVSVSVSLSNHRDASVLLSSIQSESVKTRFRAGVDTWLEFCGR